MSTKRVIDLEVGDEVLSLGAKQFPNALRVTRMQLATTKAGRRGLVHVHTGGFWPTGDDDARTCVVA